MKKVLVASAALMLAGSAQAGVNIGGDARVTYVGLSDYMRTPGETNGYSDYFESRVGVNFEGKTEKGASVNARLNFDEYGFEDDAVWNGQENTHPSVDYAYMAVPMGQHVTIKAGRIPLDYTKFFSWDIRPTRALAVYERGGVKLVPFVGVRAEASTPDDIWDDNDYMEYGLVGNFKIFPNPNWTLKAYGRYDDDQRKWHKSSSMDPVEPLYAPHKDKSGFLGDLTLTNEGGTCPLGVTAEVSYKAADVQGTEDDGLGAYVMLSKKLGRFSPAVLVGTTQDGYVADNDFGFVMVGGNESTTVMNVGEGGDLVFGAFVAGYEVSQQLTLTGNLLYADFDSEADPGLSSAVEVSGIAEYALASGASLSYKIGYLTPSYDGNAGDLEDAYLGHLLRLEFTF